MNAGKLLAQGRRYPVLCGAALLAVLAAAYWLFIASDRYVSEARVVLERSDLSAAPSTDFAALAGAPSAGNRADQLLLRDHLMSVDMTRKLEARLDLRAHFSGQGDWLSRLWREDAPVEWLHRYLQSRISVELDEYSGVLVISAQAYSPQLALAMTSALVGEGERHMNALGHQLAREQVRFLEQQVEQLGARAMQARGALLAYQNRKGMASPQAAAESLTTIVARLEGQMAELQTRRSGLATYLHQEAPQLVEVNMQIAAVDSQLRLHRARLAAPQGSSLNEAIEEYQRLQFDADFAHKVLEAALVSLQRGRADAVRTLKQVQVLQSPHLPEFAMQPRRLYNTLVAAITLLLLAGVLQLLLGIVREHQD
jgi:capsular polysaccharide transport system permease protein